jgi:TRAP-type C4-dicarboxylate transport system substrate-binding protein
MKKSALYVVGICFLALILITGTLPSIGAAAEVKEITWNFYSVLAEGDPTFYGGYPPTVKRLNDETGGRFKLNVVPAGGLGHPPGDIWNVIKKGIVPIGEMWPMFVAGKYPWNTVFELPMVYDVSDLKLDQLIVDTLWDDFAEGYAKDNLELLGLSIIPWGRNLGINGKLDPDPHAVLKGKSMRVGGPTGSWLVRTLGGTPIQMSWREVYEALQRGIVDGMDHGVSPGFIAAHMYEVLKTGVFLPGKRESLAVGSQSWVVVANKDQFNSLPPDFQKILRSTFRDAGELVTQAQAKAWGKAHEEFEKYGMKYVEVPQETVEYLKQKAPAFWEEWKKEGGDKSAKMLEELMGVVKTYKKTP